MKPVHRRGASYLPLKIVTGPLKSLSGSPHQPAPWSNRVRRQQKTYRHLTTIESQTALPSSISTYPRPLHIRFSPNKAARAYLTSLLLGLHLTPCLIRVPCPPHRSLKKWEAPSQSPLPIQETILTRFTTRSAKQCNVHLFKIVSRQMSHLVPFSL